MSYLNNKISTDRPFAWEDISYTPMNNKNNNAINNFDYSQIFIVRLKEYLMNITTKNKFLFVLKILLLLNWEKTYDFLINMLRKLFVLRIKKYIPRFSFYKTRIRRTEPATQTSTLPLIAYKYSKNKSHLMQNIYDNGKNNYACIIDQDGIEFAHDEVNYYCYLDKPDEIKNHNTKNYIIECTSNLSYDETMKRFNKLLTDFIQSDVYIFDGMDTSEIHEMIKIDRTIDTIFMQEDIENEIKKFVSKYYKLKTEYNKLGIVFKNNFLVYGCPGTGKSTLAKVIASELKRDIILFNLKEIKNIKQLQNLIYRHKHGIIVFEELDCLIERIKKRNELKKLNHSIMGQERDIYANNIMKKRINNFEDFEDDLELSDFLEILDGMRSTEDSIIFFTTNHIERIDPAFKRQGRINYLIEMKLCNKYQLCRIYEKILGREPSKDLLNSFTENKYSPSTIIQTILQNIFELRDDTLSDFQLFALVDVCHNNFIMSNNEQHHDINTLLESTNNSSTNVLNTGTECDINKIPDDIFLNEQDEIY